MVGKWYKTDYKGVRYRKHAERRHGVRFDQYFVITYKLDGKTKSESIGWASEGHKASEAFDKLCQLKKNQKSGKGPKTLKEKRAIENAAKEEKEKAKKEADEEQKRLNVSFKSLFDNVVLPDMQARLKYETWNKAKSHVKVWIHTVTGSRPIREITLRHVEKIRANLAKAKRSPRQQQYVFRSFDTVWVAAVDHGLVDRPSPTKNKSFRLPKIDNERQRYLTLDEEERLLTAVLKRGKTAHDMAIVSFNCGLRFSEIARLTWSCIDLDGGTIRVLDGKGGDRHVPMTQRVQRMFESMETGRGDHLVFPARGGKVQYQVPSSFKRAVVDAKLNEGITNQKMKASFHTLRHTYASRLVQAGVDLYRVQRLLGHSTPIMTARYSKLADDDLRDAVHAMERSSEVKRGAKIIPLHKMMAGTE